MGTALLTAIVFEPDQYQLLDFGKGRKLERFGTEVLDRPSPAAEGATIADIAAWGSATARFDQVKGGKGRWDGSAVQRLVHDEPWSVRHGESLLTLSLSSSGNVGLFPEQANNWEWIAGQVNQFVGAVGAVRKPRVLNLFAYTGGASLAAAAAGAEVTHVDSSGPTVSWAKRNAEASGAVDLPIRWLVEDAVKFAARELRRQNRYDGVILDPPTYGHGPKGRAFKFREHIDELVKSCGELLSPSDSGHSFMLFSCHVPGFGPNDAETQIRSEFSGADEGTMTSGPLDLETIDGRKLAAGVAVRWSSPSS